ALPYNARRPKQPFRKGPLPACFGLPCNRNWRSQSRRSRNVTLIPGTGGFRKARWSRAGGGKSGGVREIYFSMVRPDLIFLADIYAKNETENLTDAERNQLQKIASEIHREFGGED